MTVNAFIAELNKFKRGFWKTCTEKLGEYYTGLYWGKEFICGIPSYNIYKHSNPEYKTLRGAKHRGILETIDVCSGKGVLKFHEHLQLKNKALRWG